MFVKKEPISKWLMWMFAAGSSRVRELNEIKGRDIKDVLFGNSFLVVLEYGK